jgi:hypothetical protein
MYKIICNDKVIDVVEIPRFFRLLSTGHVAFTDKSSAQGIVGSDDRTLYAFAPLPQRNLTVVTIKEITSEELERLQSLLSSGQEPSADESALAQAKRDMISKLSGICKNKITSGFSVTLSDGESYDFKLTTEDQLNLMSIEGQLNAGAETFIYHATNQPCRFFSREDMTKIITTFKRYTLCYTSYFNVAKQYINSLVDIEKVHMFTYGTDVADIVDNIVIKQILKNGGNL